VQSLPERDCAIEEDISMDVLSISPPVFRILPRSAERYNHDHSCISTGMLFSSSLSSQVLPRVPGRYKHLHQRISVDNLILSPPSSQVLPRVSGRYNHLRSCLSMARYRVSMLKAADRTSYRLESSLWLFRCLSMGSDRTCGAGFSDTTADGWER
jgi:hypothetical protein